MAYEPITKEEYKIALSNGISRRMAYERYNLLYWSKEDSITKPSNRRGNEWKQVKDFAVVTEGAFYKRRERGMSIQEAATTPPQKNGGRKKKCEQL